MKLIVAIIEPDKLNNIQRALHEPGCYPLCVTNIGDIREPVHGCYRGAEYISPRPRLRLEVVVVNDLIAGDVMNTIVEIAWRNHSGPVSAGSVFMLPLDAWVCVPSEESRTEATAACIVS